MSYISANDIKAVILGVAVADALGVPVEFKSREKLKENPVTGMREFGTYPVPAGSWSDDTSMTLCALDALADSGDEMNLDGVMENFGKWYYNNEYTPTGKMFDVGNTCRFAINSYIKGGADISGCGLDSEHSNGNGSLMRIAPFVLFALQRDGGDNPRKLWDTVSDGSMLTHAHRRSCLACEIYASTMESLLKEKDKNAVWKGIEYHRSENGGEKEYIHFDRIRKGVLENLNVDEIKSTGYVVDTLEAALWCLLTTGSYGECVLKAVNLGDDTDTVAAVAGGLAGALYGLDGIPEEWLSVLKKRDYIEALCEKAAGNRNNE